VLKRARKIIKRKNLRGERGIIGGGNHHTSAIGGNDDMRRAVADTGELNETETLHALNLI